MGDLGDYWRESRYRNVKKSAKQKVHVEPVCDICGKKLPDVNRMRQHRKAAHGKGEVNAEAKRRS